MAEDQRKQPLTRSRQGIAPRPEWPLRGPSLRVTPDAIARAARELVAAYGPKASQLMLKRMHAVRRRGDAQSASLWSAVARATEEQMGMFRGGNAD